MNLKMLAANKQLWMTVGSLLLGGAQMLLTNNKEALDKQILKAELKEEVLKEILEQLGKNK